VEIVQNPRYIDESKCIACGACAEKCPKKMNDPYNMGLSKRKAAYVEYAQAVPLKYAIDSESCIYLQKKKCGACKKICPTGAVDFDQKPEILTLNGDR
jgi:heterodisulfide reductase subunit A